MSNFLTMLFVCFPAFWPKPRKKKDEKMLPEKPHNRQPNFVPKEERREAGLNLGSQLQRRLGAR